MAMSMDDSTCPSCKAAITHGIQTGRASCLTCGGNYVAGMKPPSQRGQGEGSERLPNLPQSPGDETDQQGKKRFSGLSSFFNSLGGKSKDGNSKKDKSSPSPGGGGTKLPTIQQGQAIVNQSGEEGKKRSSGRSPSKGSELKGYTPMTMKQFEFDIDKAKSSGDYKTIQTYYEMAFASFAHVNATFMDSSKDPKSTEDSALQQAYVDLIFKHLPDLPSDIKKITLKAIINGLLKDLKKARNKDDLRAYLVLIQNPQFTTPATYVIFAHLLRQMSGLCDQDHHYLVHWFRRLSNDTFKSIVNRLIQFISVRLFPPDPAELPAIGKCAWWVPSATKVLALLNAANTLSIPNKIPYTSFYASTLDHVDLMKEYYAWQNPNNYQTFTFCQYPFILSLQAKRTIMQKDSEQQMIMTARRSLVAKVQQRQMPDMNMLFLTLKVRRSHLVSDSLHEIANKKHDLKKKLRVVFANEPGLDLGGLTKEWFLLLIRKIFREEYGMFTYNSKARCFWFNPGCVECNQEFNLVGVLMGLAVYNGTILDIRFPACVYKKLLNPAVVPYNNPGAEVGRTAVSLDDLKEFKPDLANGLKETLQYEGNVEDDLCMSFQASYSSYGSTQTHDLKQKGGDIPVTNKNRKEYVQLYINYLLNESIYHQFAAFYHGFHSVCASNALIMLRPEEVEMLVCGSPNFDLDALERVTNYDGYKKSDPTVRYFWEVVKAFPEKLQKKLLLFSTGSDRIPIGGMGEMSFKIIRVDTSSAMLPMSHTCFNQLILPPYKNKKTLKQKLTIAISNAEGFGLE